MPPQIYAQGSSQVQQLGDALNASDVTGWNVLAAVVVVVGGIALGSLVRRLTVKAVRRIDGVPEGIAQDAGRAAAWLAYIVAGAMALSILGVSVGWVTIVVVVVAIVGVLMVRPMIENSAAGMLLTIRPAFGVNDQIGTVSHEGTVTEIGSRSTVLKTSDGRKVHVPNTEVLSQPIIVYTAFDSRKASFDITVEPDTDLERTTKLLLAAIADVKDVRHDPPAAVQATGVVNNAVVLSISYWYPSSMTSDGPVTDGVIRATMPALADAGIKLAIPPLDVSAPRGTLDATTPTPHDAAGSSANDDDQKAHASGDGQQSPDDSRSGDDTVADTGKSDNADAG